MSRSKGGGTEERWSDRLANGLTWLLLIATGVLLTVFAAIAVDPSLPINPYPPTAPSLPPSPSPTPFRQSGTATSTASPFVTPTPLRPTTPSPTPEPTMPFSATVRQESGADCTRPFLAGTVTDQEGEPLVGYPIHVWGPEVDTILLSGSAPARGPSGWEVVDGVRGGESWFVQLHLPDPHHVYPPLSGIVEVTLPEACPQATIHFQQRR